MISRFHPQFIDEIHKQVSSFTKDDLDRIERSGLDLHDLIQMIAKPQDHTLDALEISDLKDIVQYVSISQNISDIGVNVPHEQISICSLLDSESDVSKISSNKEGLRHWVFCNNKQKEQIDLKDNLLICNLLETCALTPDNRLFCVDEKPIFVSTGSGDLISLIKEDQEYKDFVAKGGKYVIISDSGHFDPVLLGQHVVSGASVTCTLSKRKERDSRPVLCNNAGDLMLVENCRISRETETLVSSKAFAGTMIINADLNFDLVKFLWLRKRSIINGSIAVSFFRSLVQLTELFETQFVEVKD